MSRRITVSVFVKLTVIMLVMVLSLVLIVVAFFWAYVGEDLVRSEGRMVGELVRAFAATSPDLATARRLGSHVDVQTRYEGPDAAWTTDDDLPSIEEARNDHPEHAWMERELYLVAGPHGGTYLFVWTYHLQMRRVHTAMLRILIFVIAAVGGIAYLFLRYLLRPLRGLGEGVARLSEGQFDVVLPNSSRDEFGLLTNAFNQMVQRVREMIRARDQLLLDVSHELRSPLTRLKVALEMLPPVEKRAQMAADIAEMEIMIAELLELERLRDGRGIQISRQDLMPILHDLTESFRDRAPGVRLIVGTQEVPLDIDTDKLRMVFRNLLENAAKYSLPDSRAVQISTAVDDKTVVVRVSDDGPGIPPEDVANLFEPFFRVDRSRSKKTGGYGLGLSICKRIIDAHGGTIAVENNAGRGASFIVSLPKPA